MSNLPVNLLAYLLVLVSCRYGSDFSPPDKLWKYSGVVMSPGALLPFQVTWIIKQCYYRTAQFSDTSINPVSHLSGSGRIFVEQDVMGS